MSLYSWLKKLNTQARDSRTNRPRRAQAFRPSLEALEDRVVLDTRIWTGGGLDHSTGRWSDIFNWQNPALIPFSPPVLEGDSVEFPATAISFRNLQDIGPIGLDTLHLVGSGISGQPINFNTLINDTGANDIRNHLSYTQAQSGTIQVNSGSLDLQGGLIGLSVVTENVDLIKTGAGTLKISSIIGDDRDPSNTVTLNEFRTFVVQGGMVSLEAGGQLRVNLLVQNGGIVRLQQGGDQIAGPGRVPFVTIDAGGQVELNNHDEGLGVLTLNGGMITTGLGTLNVERDVTTTASATEALIDGRMKLNADRTFSVANGTAATDLQVFGSIQGTGGLIKNGDGKMELAGLAPNTYSGRTTVNQGQLALAKSDNVEAVVGQLIIGDGVGGTNADRVLLFGDEQISQNFPVRVNSSGLLALNGNTETLGGLILAGGNVASGTLGLLILRGNVTTESAATAATISGHLSLANVNGLSVFNVANGIAQDDLIVSGSIQGAGTGLVKSGAGELMLSGSSANTYTGATFVDEGILRLAKSDNVESVVGDLVIGDGGGGNNADRVILSGDEQISTNSFVKVNSSGLLDLSGHTETLGGLILAGGNVTTSTGLLKLLGNVTTESAPTAPTISGRLSLANPSGVPRVFNVADAVGANDLFVNAAILDGALTKTGPGQMSVTGPGANTYTGATLVNQGILALAKPDNVEAVIGPLIIGDGVGGTNADRVVLVGDEQIATGKPVRVNSSGLLDLSGHTETLGQLILAGGNVTTGSGLLKLVSDVTTESAPRLATISGRLSLANVNGIPRFFAVFDSVAGPDLLVNAAILDGGLTKGGLGDMELTANSPYSLDTTINEGRLMVTGTLSNSQVRLNTTGTLAGGGSVRGITTSGGTIQPGHDGIGTLTSTADVALQAGASFQPEVNPLSGDPHDLLKVQGAVSLGGAALSVQPTPLATVPSSAPLLIDDSGPGFTATSGFGLFQGGLNNNVHAAGSNGAEQATWIFQNLQPGSYRVSATWSDSPFRSTNAPYTILDGAAPVTTVRVNQQLPGSDFSAFGVNWDILGVVQVTGNSLTVRLTNDANGTVIADAILLDPHQVVIVDNDGSDAVVGTFAGLPEGAQFGVVATVGAQSQTQLYTISYRANDGNDVGLAYVTTATAAENLKITPASINEGQKVTLTGKLTDPDTGDFLTLTINWGDGKTETHHPGTDTFQFAHRYLDNPRGQPHGAFTVHLTWFDQHGAGNSRDLTVTVNNVAPTVFLPADVDVRPNGLLVVAGRFTDPGVLDRWTATVNYGDGTGTQALKLNPDQHFVLQHRYQRPGAYRVTVTVTDDDGESGTAKLLADVDLLRPHG